MEDNDVVEVDDKKFRVTLICEGRGYSEGYGHTLEAAEAKSREHYRKQFGRKKESDRWNERVSDDGRRYVQF